MGTADSTANLLDDVEGNPGGESSVCVYPLWSGVHHNQHDEPILVSFVQKKTACRDEPTLREPRSRAASPYHGDWLLPGHVTDLSASSGLNHVKIVPLLIPDLPTLHHIRFTMARAS